MATKKKSTRRPQSLRTIATKLENAGQMLVTAAGDLKKHATKGVAASKPGTGKKKRKAASTLSGTRKRKGRAKLRVVSRRKAA